MTDQEILAVAKGQVEAYNERDFDKFASLVSADLIFNEMPTGRVIKGIDEFRLIWNVWTTAFPDNYGDILNAFTTDNIAVLELAWSGTHNGPLLTPEKEFPPTGNEFSNGLACQIVYVNEGKVTKINHYFDILSIMRQLNIN
ncbi:MAG: ester cyclase [Thermodesulfobacteriota bacterium]